MSNMSQFGPDTPFQNEKYNKIMKVDFEKMAVLNTRTQWHVKLRALFTIKFSQFPKRQLNLLHGSFTLGNLISLLPTVWFVLFKAFKLFFVIFSCNKNRFLMKKLNSLTTYSIHTKQQNNKTIDEYSFHFCINNLFLFFFLILKI